MMECVISTAFSMADLFCHYHWFLLAVEIHPVEGKSYVLAIIWVAFALVVLKSLIISG